MIGSACLGGWLQRKTEVGVVHDESLLPVFIDIFGKDNVFLEIHTYQGEGQKEPDCQNVRLYDAQGREEAGAFQHEHGRHGRHDD